MILVTPVPPPAMKALEKFSYVAITGTSDEKGGSGALRIGMANKKTNSLAAFIELIPLLQAMDGGDSRAAPEDRSTSLGGLEEEWEKKPKGSNK